ncbi:ABC transporter permease [Nocardia sp. AG03]|uniref:ABC transporter permease n=1 Tax=Nocardia sp. AG03 TaxID=3025312 RepID=UPI002418A2DB|nr:ABC transporter permease [Nocardia sp. AG03]
MTTLRAVLFALVRRLLGVVGLLTGVATLTFVAMSLVPGDPAYAMLGNAPATPATLAAIRAQMGLDEPPYLRFLHYLGRLAQGDFGESFQRQQPVLAVIGAQLTPTLQLAGAAIVLGVGGAILVVLATSGERRVPRAVAHVAELVAVSAPTFWVGTLLLAGLSFHWRVFPATGRGPAALVLPALTLAVPIAAVLAQVMRDGVDTALRAPFVLSARARGAGELDIRVHHAVRHTLLSAITVAGWLFAGLLSGAVLVETVFARPGLGRVLLSAVTTHDFPVVIALVMFGSLLFIVINTAVDLAYRVIDPRSAVSTEVIR